LQTGCENTKIDQRNFDKARSEKVKSTLNSLTDGKKIQSFTYQVNLQHTVTYTYKHFCSENFVITTNKTVTTSAGAGMLRGQRIGTEYAMWHGYQTQLLDEGYITLML
jgi:hypothetical protein